MFSSFPGAVDFQNIMKHYREVLTRNISEYESNISNLVIPIISEAILQNLCKTVTYYFRREPTMIKIDSPIIVIGDLHGHLLDLLRILKKMGLPPIQKYVFLGDIIDRGEFSLETLTLIFVMKVLYPQNIFVIRGNHEFQEICKNGGFIEELHELYPSCSALEKCFYDAFSYIPLAILISNKILCLHGGIGPSVKTLKDIQMIQRPLLSYNAEKPQSILWSDPTMELNGFSPSPRGSGYLYGQDVLLKFLQDNNLDLLIRGHECVNEGISTLFQKRLATVFSASNYCGVYPNKASVLSIITCTRKEAIVFLPLKYIPRTKAVFIKSEKDNAFYISKSLFEKELQKVYFPSLSMSQPLPRKSTVRIGKKVKSDKLRKDRTIGIPMDRRTLSGIILTHQKDSQSIFPREKSVRKMSYRSSLK